MEEERRDNSEQSIGKEIVIDSDTPVYRPAEDSNHLELQAQEAQATLVHPRFPFDISREEQRQRDKVKNAIEMFQEIQEQERGEESSRKAMLDKRREKEKKMQKERQVRKQFQHSSYLSITALEDVKAMMQTFEGTCKIETVPKEQRQFSKQRQQFRRLLTRAFLLLVEELREKTAYQDLTTIQSDLVSANKCHLMYCYNMSTQIEIFLFERIVLKGGKGMGMGYQNYQKQMKLVIREIFNDKNNFEGRRDMINRRIHLNILSTASEDQLKCKKTKGEEWERRLQLIRESEKDPLGTEKREPESDNVEIMFNSKPSFQSQSSIMEDQPPKEPEEQVILRQKRKLNTQSIERFQACREVISKYVSEQEERVSSLKQKYASNTFFMELCGKVKI